MNHPVQGRPLASSIATESHTKKTPAQVINRRVQYRIVAAPLDASPRAPGAKYSDKVVTDSASNLNGLPFAVTAKGDNKRILHRTLQGKSYAEFGRPHHTAEINVPDDVVAVEIYLGNDAYEARRLHPLFVVAPDTSGLTIIEIHEIPQVRLTRLQASTESASRYPAADRGQTTKIRDNNFIGYLTGDTWRDLSYEFTSADVLRLCGVSFLERPFIEDRGRSRVTPLEVGAGATLLGPVRPQRLFELFEQHPPAEPFNVTTTSPGAIRNKDKEVLAIPDWTVVLSPIYEGRIEELSGESHDRLSGYVDLPLVNIRVSYQTGAFANAVGAGSTVRPADVLKRTNPLAYKGIIEAAWKSGIDELTISSTWRPMLGSKLHRMGVAVDVVFVDDYDDRNVKGNDVEKFRAHIGSGKSPSELYSTFSAVVFSDNTNLTGFKADPWHRKASDNLHKNHLHVSATDPDAR
ncbi:hypothetical protein [Montanilutibacter psychrotolerans]|uniref:hypothetical protein n=1 Tax=Montanilutibacter psychrotolerans TaxID=1327343 RepID=UPI0011CDFA20|nr:hypothetical protein [Lysobacter psychrotolerans]